MRPAARRRSREHLVRDHVPEMGQLEWSLGDMFARWLANQAARLGPERGARVLRACAAFCALRDPEPMQTGDSATWRRTRLDTGVAHGCHHLLNEEEIAFLGREPA